MSTPNESVAMEQYLITRTASEDNPQPYAHGRCEVKIYSPKHAGYAYCGKRGRWLVRSEIRCGEHKEHGA